MRNVLFRKFFIVTLSLSLPLFFLPRLSADDSAPAAADVMDMVAGDIQTITVNNLTRVSVTNPEVADIADAEGDKVSLLAKKGGETVLFLWDSNGKRSIKVRVVNEDLNALKDLVQKLLDEANITDVSLENNLDVGKVVLSGSLSKEDKNRMESILQPYSDNLLDLVKEDKSEDLVQVDMQIIEINTSLEKNLGIEWGTTTGQSGSGVSLNYNENLPSGDKFKDLFKIGNFQRQSPLQVTVNTLIQEGKARLISKPRLVVVSGKQASFLVGGEIPVSTTTTNTTGSTLTQNTSYTQYGVNLTVTPTIREGKVDVLLNVDIRDIDSATPISSSSGSSGNNIAFITRTAQTELFMDNKQTIVLAGLIKYADNVTNTRLPFLSKLPIVGALFRNTSSGYPSADTNTEMVIILTPTVLTDKKIADTQVVMPTPEEEASYKEIDSKYGHEAIHSDWPPAKTAPASDPNSSAATTASNAAPADNASTPAASTTAPAAAASTAAPAAPTDPVSVMTAYARMVQEKISKAIIFPPAGNSAGTVKLKLSIHKDGSISSAEVVESSGSVVLDQDAIQAARSAAPYDAFSTGMDQDDMTFTIPIVYNSLISGGQDPTKVVAAE